VITANSKKAAGKWRIVALAGLLSVAPVVVEAYVDPGLVASGYQIVYTVIFGLILGWLLRPFSYMRSLLRRWWRYGEKEGPRRPR